MANAYEYDVKEDEEQNVKLQETVELLVASGYFRARIKGLSSFDKVVGGIVWCISICNYDIDVNLFFQENATIGQKIALTEKIVTVLQVMKCPHRVDPHQIQGLDFIHIFPVVQWLVKKAIENKKGYEDSNRSHALMHFNKHIQLSQDENFKTTSKIASSNIQLIDQIFQPQRKFKRLTDDTSNLDERLKVQSTLLEYGKKYYGLQSSTTATTMTSSSATTATKQIVDNKQIVDQQQLDIDMEQMNALMSEMSSMDLKKIIIAPDVVSSIVKHHADEIHKLTTHYDEKRQKQQEEQQIPGKKCLTTMKQNIEKLRSTIQELNDEKAVLEEEVQQSENRLKPLLDEENKLNILQNEIETIENDLQHKNHLDKMASLVARHEELKKREVAYKENCVAEQTRFEEAIERLKSSDQSINQLQESAESQELEQDLMECKEKLKKIRLILARKNREISALQQQIDNVPTRSELNQYQFRFIELHNQVSSKHKETKQYYALYNTLDDTRLYLDKEVNLLNSIHDNFEKAMLSETQKTVFMKQFEQIVEGVRQNKIKVDRKKQDVKMLKMELQDKLNDLMERQRLYFKTVKDFQDECKRNELLQMKLQQVMSHDTTS